MWSDQIIQFYSNIQSPVLPFGVEALMPFEDKAVMNVFGSFYRKFYSDNEKRVAIIGINPGRFGGGVTGIPFTDPIRLQNACGIENDFTKRQELSSVYMYEMMDAFGGPGLFYKKFYISSYSPIGFIKDGKNLNYYDDKELAAAIGPFAGRCLQEQLSWNLDNNIAFCLGDGKNFQWLSRLNTKYHFFDKIIPLSHPRFIMQYKLKLKNEYIEKYIAAFAQHAAL